MRRGALRIGEPANATGLTTKTIRYYELVRLLGNPQRSDSGYCLYARKVVERLEFIRKSKRLGFSLPTPLSKVRGPLHVWSRQPLSAVVGAGWYHGEPVWR